MSNPAFGSGSHPWRCLTRRSGSHSTAISRGISGSKRPLRCSSIHRGLDLNLQRPHAPGKEHFKVGAELVPTIFVPAKLSFLAVWPTYEQQQIRRVLSISDCFPPESLGSATEPPSPSPPSITPRPSRLRRSSLPLPIVSTRSLPSSTHANPRPWSVSSVTIDATLDPEFPHQVGTNAILSEQTPNSDSRSVLDHPKQCMSADKPWHLGRRPWRE